MFNMTAKFNIVNEKFLVLLKISFFRMEMECSLTKNLFEVLNTFIQRSLGRADPCGSM